MGETDTVGTDVKNSWGQLLPGMFARYKDDLDGELRAAMEPAAEASERGDLAAALFRMLGYHMGWVDEMGDPLDAPISQGKAVRPTLCLFACEALSEDWARALPAAAALEFIHNFSLIHDDIQDGDVERRHRPTVWSLWGQPHALVAGDALRSLADITALGLTRRGVAEETALRASFLLTRAYLDMTTGQCLDLAFEERLEIGLEDYLAMISCKTGALIRCGMGIGALIASDEEETVQAFARCGSFLGLAFQVRDDVLGIWGDADATGKSVGNDIRRKKKSLPIVYAMEVSKDAARQKLVDTYSKQSLDDQDVQDVLAVMDELNVANYAQNVTREKASLALNEVRRLTLPAWAGQEIEELVEFLSAREY